jgi:hypothetical protein
VISRMGKTVPGSDTNNVASGSSVAQCSTGVTTMRCAATVDVGQATGQATAAVYVLVTFAL